MSKLTLGEDPKAKGVQSKPGYFNPLTGKFDAETRYTQHLNIGTRESNWLPRGLTVRDLYLRKTDGYRRRKAAEGIPGWVWVVKK